MTEEREARRRSVVLAGTIIHERKSFRCRVRDVSAGGCRIECDTLFPPATAVHVELSRYGKFPAVVAWAKGRTMGIVFPEGSAGALARFGDNARNLGLVEDGE